MKTLDAFPIRFQRLTAREYMAAIERDERAFKSARFVAPSLGSKNFGYFEVEYRSPSFSVLRKSRVG